MNKTDSSDDYEYYDNPPVPEKMLFGESAVVTFFGIVFNSLVLYVLTKPEFLKQPLYRYYMIATIFDTMA